MKEDEDQVILLLGNKEHKFGGKHACNLMDMSNNGGWKWKNQTDKKRINKKYGVIQNTNSGDIKESN